MAKYVGFLNSDRALADVMKYDGRQMAKYSDVEFLNSDNVMKTRMTADMR